MDMQFVEILGIVIVILCSMTIHELAHGLVAYRLGDDTARLSGRLSLNPLRHIDPFMTIILPILLAMSNLPIFGGAKPVPVNTSRLKYGEWGMALVSISGPLTNLLIAFVSYLLYVWLTPNVWIYMTMMINLGFFVFNILPIPPLDGSRVLYALAPESVRRGMEWIERYGVLLVFGLVLVMSQFLTVFITRAIYSIIEVFHAFVTLF